MRRSQAPSQHRKPLLSLKPNTTAHRPMTLTCPTKIQASGSATTTATATETENRGDVSAVSVAASTSAEPEATGGKAYKVFWCNFTRKKHKTYNDGVLVTSSSSCTLLDEEGKTLCKSTTMGKTALANLQSGSLLTVCSKEVEINEEVPYASYESGALFIKTGAAGAAAVPTAKCSARMGALLASKKFPAGPLRKGAGQGQLPQPRHDPSAPGALVLDPGKEGQSVAVVMDPYLSKHLREHQREGVKFMYECVMGLKDPHMLGCILADEMGLGKTFQSICVLWTLLKQGPKGIPTIRKAMIVCPNTLISNWEKEIKYWLGKERLNPLTLGDSKSKSMCTQTLKDFSLDKHPVLIISYEQLRNNISAINPSVCGLIICDEAHRIKNSTCKTALALQSLTASRKILLTGTPIQNDLSEFYAMVDFCNPGMLGTIAAFKNTFERPISMGNDPKATSEQKALGKERAATLTAITSKVVLRRLSTILSAYLPVRHEIVLMCRPSPAQVTLYKRCLASQGVREMLLSEGSHGVPALSCLQMLTKICSHPGLLPKEEEEEEEGKEKEDYNTTPPQTKRRKICDDNSSYGEEDDDDEEEDDDEVSYVKELGIRSVLPEGFGEGERPDPHVELSGKMEVLDAMLREIRRTTDDKVVLISNFTRTLDWFERLCAVRGYAYARLDGSTESTQRQKLVDMFNTAKPEKCFAFLLSCKAGGVGINLIGANRLFLYEPDWNPAWDKQSMARVWRDGQKKEVYIYRMLTTGTIEEKIFQRQLSKQNLSRSVVLDNFEVNKSFAKEDLKAVFYLNEHTACDTHDLIKCDCQAGKPAEPAVDECEGEELDKTKTKMKMKRRGPGRGLLRGNARRRSCKNSDGDNKADECSAILKQWEHIGDCSKINDSIIAGAGVDKVISFAFYMRSDKKIESNSIREDKGNEIIKDVKEKEEEEEEEEEEEIKDGEDEEDVYVDVNTETNTTITTDNNNNKEEENNEKMLYEGDDDIFSDINLE